MALGIPLRLTLLGGFELRRGDQELALAASAQRLVALLALSSRPVGRPHVAGSLWPDYSTERSLAGLRTALWRVNQSCDQLIVATSSLLVLDPRVAVDVRALVTFADQLGEPEASCPGPNLDSLNVTDLACELLPDWYDDWLLDEREGLRQTRLHALERLARGLSAAGRHAEAIQAALVAIRLEPLRETAHQTLIQVHLDEGNWSEACRQFQRCRRLLQEELGIEPSESIRLLLESRPRERGFHLSRYALPQRVASIH